MQAHLAVVSLCEVVRSLAVQEAVFAASWYQAAQQAGCCVAGCSDGAGRGQ